MHVDNLSWCCSTIERICDRSMAVQSRLLKPVARYFANFLSCFNVIVMHILFVYLCHICKANKRGRLFLYKFACLDISKEILSDVCRFFLSSVSFTVPLSGRKFTLRSYEFLPARLGTYTSGKLRSLKEFLHLLFYLFFCSFSMWYLFLFSFSSSNCLFKYSFLSPFLSFPFTFLLIVINIFYTELFLYFCILSQKIYIS